MVTQSKCHSKNSVNGVLQENTSLGRDCHAGQVAPDRNHATVPNESKKIQKAKPRKICTWNVRSLYQKGKFDNIKLEMKRMELDVLGMSEVRWTGAGTLTSDGCTLIYSGGDQHQHGVGIVLNTQTAKALKGYWPVSERIIAVTIQGEPFDTSIIQVYAPTSDHDDTQIEQFYEDLDNTLKQLKSSDIKIVMGDFNAKVGQERISNVVGPYGIGVMNERGERLVEWCTENNFTVMNTWFDNHPRRKWTWKSPDGRTRNQIDFILIQSRFRNSVLSTRSMPGADCGSDHNPVMCKMRVKLKAIRKSKNIPKFQLEVLRKDNNIREQFAVSVRNKFSILEAVTTAEEKWQNLKQCITEAMEENVPTTKRKEDKKWMTKEILDLMENRRKAKQDCTKHKSIDKLIKEKCNVAKEEWINQQCQLIEDANKTDFKFMHKKIKEVSNKKPQSQTGCIKSSTGDILIEKKDILLRWAEYIEELFYDVRGEKPQISKTMEGPAILQTEVEKAIKATKKGKSVGPDNIPVEAFEALDEWGVKQLTELLNTIYNTGEIPNDLSTSIFITLPKKPGTTDCGSHRTISLMSHTMKILLRILMERIRTKLRPEISETQFGFVADKGTTNAIFTLQMLMERGIEVQKNIFLCFIDYSKAFDKVKHEELFKMLTELDIDGKDLRILRNLYWEQTAAVRIDKELSDFKPIRRGVRQGCVLSPDLFNFYSEMILRGIAHLDGIKVGGRNLNNLRYADDTALIAESERMLNEILDVVAEESKNKGLELNIAKTESMVVTKNAITPSCTLERNGELIKQVNKFKYLGYTITTDGRSDTEIKKRIGIAKDTFKKMSPVLNNRNISMGTKIRTLKAYVWSVLLYGCECWTISSSIKKRLEATEMWFIRRMLRISWKEKRTNEEVLAIAGIKRTLIEAIRSRQMRFLGHIYRKRGLEHLSLTGKIDGKKSRGRQRMKYVENINNWATGKSVDNINFLRAADDRMRWRTMITDVCSRQGT